MSKDDKKDKPRTVDDIVGKYQAKTGASFEERLATLTDFHHPNNKDGDLLDDHAETRAYTAYQAAEGKLKKDLSKPVGDKEAIEKILETYMDSFLKETMSDDQFKAMQEQISGLDSKEKRDYKRGLVGIYSIDKNGRAYNPFGEKVAERLAGKTGIDVKKRLKKMREQLQEGHGRYLGFKATDGLIKNEDHPLMSAKTLEVLTTEGWDHPTDKPHTRSAHENISHYIAGKYKQGDTLRQLGYEHKNDKPDKQ